MLLKVIVLNVILCSFGMAQHQPEPMKISADYARFRGEENTLYVEIYYSIPSRSLTYVPDNGAMKGEADVTLLVTKGDSIVRADRWLVPSSISDTAKMMRAMNLVGLTATMLPEGVYIAKLIARDRQNERRVDSISLRIPIVMVPPQNLALSDVEIASSIRQGREGGQFYKNTLDVIPNVDAIFSEEQSCFMYAEAYNILATNDRSDYYVKTSVYNAVGKEIISREKPRKRSGESSVIVDNITVKNLNTGTYTLLLSLLDSTKRSVSSSARKFYVYNKVLGVDSSLLALDTRASMVEYAKMDSAELDQEYHWIQYVASDPEKTQYEELRGADAKRTFLHDFWMRRPEGYRTEYLNRVEYANRTFSAVRRDGYREDRGRVYIMYGPPTEIDRHPSEADSRPYEIWVYDNIQGGVNFVFVQRQIGNDYMLVHSTHRNEIQDPNWQRYTQSTVR